MKSLQTPRERSVTVKPRLTTLHPAEEDLEGFLFGRLEECQRQNLESHLRGCTFCRESLVKMDFAGELRMATGVPEHCSSWPVIRGTHTSVDAEESRGGATALTLQCLAHDLNNVFQTLVYAANLLSDDPCWAPVSAAMLRTIERGKRITDCFQEMEQTPALFETILANAIAFAQDSLIGGKGPEIRFVCDVEPGIELRRSRAWERVLLNLFSNAMSAMPAGGTISVSLRISNGNVEIMVRDQGQGIASEIFADLFRPHVSTKVGGGLGLHIVETIVKQDHGEVRAVNCLDGPGAAFIITVPSWQTQSQCPAAPGLVWARTKVHA
jgi:nitrogen-specific signal transduction histidine kinase